MDNHDRVANRIQLTSDGLKWYFHGVSAAFGHDIDYGVLRKLYGSQPGERMPSVARWRNHAAAVALYYFSYNFVKIHGTLLTTPAMAAGVTDRLWDVSDLVTLEASEQGLERAA